VKDIGGGRRRGRSCGFDEDFGAEQFAFLHTPSLLLVNGKSSV